MRFSSRFLNASLCVGAVALGACGVSTGDTGAPAPAPSPASTPATSTRGAAPTAAAAHPAGVPAEYVATPNGYFHPSCLHEVRKGERVSERGEIVGVDGLARALPACAHPRYDRRGHEIAMRILTKGKTYIPTIDHSWLAAFDETVEGVTWQSATFRVPDVPLNNDGQVVFFFNALEPFDGSEIIQPVLQWNNAGSGIWEAASWYVDPFGNGMFSTPVAVNAGDTLNGYMFPYGGGNWFIGMNDNGAYSTGFSISSAANFDWVFGGAMEVYSVANCGDLPSTGFEFFTDEAIYQNGSPITPSWSNMTFSGFDPDCNVSPFSATTLGGMSWLYQ